MCPLLSHECRDGWTVAVLSNFDMQMRDLVRSTSESAREKVSAAKAEVRAQEVAHNEEIKSLVS